MALPPAHQQLKDLQKPAAQPPAPQPGASFLPRNAPWPVPPSWGYSAPPPPPPPAAPAYGAPPPYSAPQPYGAPQPYAAPPPQAPPSTGHSFLRTAAITARAAAPVPRASYALKSHSPRPGDSHPLHPSLLR